MKAVDVGKYRPAQRPRRPTASLRAPPPQFDAALERALAESADAYAHHQAPPTANDEDDELQRALKASADEFADEQRRRAAAAAPTPQYDPPYVPPTEPRRSLADLAGPPHNNGYAHVDDDLARALAASRGGTYAFGDGAGGGRGSQAASSRASPVQTPQVQGPSTGAGRHATCARGPRHDAHATMRPSGRAQRSQRVPLSKKASAQTALSLIAVRGRRGAELRGRRGALGARLFTGASTSSGSSPNRLVALRRRGPSITIGLGGGGGCVGRAASSARCASSARALRTGWGVTPRRSLKSVSYTHLTLPTKRIV